MHGSYQKTVEGLPYLASIHLTGAPADHLPSDQAKFYEGGSGWNENAETVEDFWSKIVAARQRNYSLMGTTRRKTAESFNNKAHERGIIASQSYPILDVISFTHKNKGQRLLKLRNT